MPDPIEPQLDELRRRARRRLIGAIVLALAAAVLVPMLLESDPKPLGEDVSVRIPPVDDSKFVSKLGDKGKATAEPPVAARATTDPPKAEPAVPMTVPVAPPAPPKDASSPPPSRTLAQAEQRVISPGSKPAPAEPVAKPSTGEPAKGADTAKPVAEVPKAAVEAPKAAPEPAKSVEPAKAAEAPKAADAAKAAEPAKGAPGAYSVQLAAFTDDKGANALAAKLKKAGHPSYIEPYETSRGRVWRVRVGPYPSREAAESARTRLKAEGQNGILAAAK